MHVCGVVPLHCVAPGVHTPVQAPPEQMCAQVTAASHCPSGPHSWVLVVPMHCETPVWHTPQSPEPLQYGEAVGQVVAALHCPFAPQVSVPLPEH